MKDAFLIKRLQNGESKAYDYVMDSYYEKLCNYAHSLIQDHDNAEDIVQTVMISLWQNRKKLKQNLSLKSFLYKSVYNRFIDEYRKNKPVLYLEKQHLEIMYTIAEKEHDNLEQTIKIVYQEIQNLPNKCRKVFLLSKQEGLTHIEISEYLGLSVKTVEGHISRAFKILNNRLGDKVNTLLFLLFSKPLNS